MKLRHIIHKLLDDIVGYHKDCLCNSIDCIDFYEGKVVSLYVDGKLFVPAQNGFYPNVHMPECEDQHCGGCIPIHPNDLKDMNK